ncbi:MAG: hypothetical protein NTX59_02970 [Elusimicrobia bacterium]|nr:hypothetical protein [Elusimicrobiota bacterium]
MSVLIVSCGGQKTVIKHGALDNGRSDIVIAILPLINNSADKSLDSIGITLSDLISAQMAAKKGFKLVERQRIEEMLSELKLGQSGVVDQNAAIQVGKMLGANVMAFGSFSSFGKKVLLTIRLIKVETGEIVGGVSERSSDVYKLDVLAENAAKKLSDSLAHQ